MHGRVVSGDNGWGGQRDTKCAATCRTVLTVSSGLFPKVKKGSSPDRCGFVGWVSSHKAKDFRFDSGLGHMPGLQVQSPVGVHARGN